MIKSITKALVLFTFIFGLSNCTLLTKTQSGYKDFTNESKLDSTQLSYKKHLQKFTSAILKKEDLQEFIADSMYCSWEVGGDSTFINYNDKKISKQDFLKNYSYKVFNAQYTEYINNDKNIFSIHKETSPHLDGKNLKGFSVTFGPKKCPWEPCSYEHFEFIKTKTGYKLYKMWFI